MAYVNFKEERYFAREQFKKRRANNEKIFKEIREDRYISKCYIANKEYSFRNFSEKHFGGGRILYKEEFVMVENEDIICAKFEECTWGNIKFKECNFIGCVFNDCDFKSGGIVFENCNFFKEESEKKPSLNRKDNFSCEFNRCKIYGKFDGCTLSYSIFSECLFYNTVFKLTDMTSCIIINSEFKKIDIEDCDLSGAKIINTYISDLDFTDKLKTKLDEKTFFDVIPCRYKNRDEYEGLYMTYETIADKFKSNSLNNNFGEYYYLGKVIQRKTIDFPQKISSFFYWASCGYGQRPLNSILFSLGVIGIFAIVYLLIGIKVDGKDISYIFNGIKGYGIMDFLIHLKDSITYSIDLFTGIGADDIEPINFTLLFINIEKILGFICMGIGVGTVTRKLIR